jgi:glucose-1-phosphate cytidylyltransferase
MKVIILAGGLGTRLSEETQVCPKPMVEIGGKPILWHIMKIYSSYGFNDFVILLGYKSYIIKEYMANYFLHQSDITVNLANNEIKVLSNASEPWKVTLLDTGINTMTGGRILRAKQFVGDEPFMLTYGDGVSDIDINSLLKFHRSHGKTMTITVIQPEGRYGVVESDSEGLVKGFIEKPKGDGTWVNGGFFVCQPKVFDYIQEGDNTIFEHNPITNMVKDQSLYCYKHLGFWHSMDTLRDKMYLNKLWEDKKAKWEIWE